MTSSSFKLCCFSMFDPETPSANCEIRENWAHYLQWHLKLKCTGAIYFRKKSVKKYLNSIKISKKCLSLSWKEHYKIPQIIYFLQIWYSDTSCSVPNKQLCNFLNVKPWNIYFEVLVCETIVTCRRRNNKNWIKSVYLYWPQ